ASSSASGSRSRRASSQINETGSWYDDDPSTSRLGDSMYDAAPIKRSRLPILVGFVGVLALGGVIFAMTRTGEDAAPPKQDEPVAATPPPVDVAPSVIMDSDHASVPPSQIVSTAPPTKPATTTTITTTPTPAAKTRTSSRTTSRSSASSDTG